MASVQGTTDPARFSDTIISHLSVKVTDKQMILEAVDIDKRLEKLLRASGERE